MDGEYRRPRHHEVPDTGKEPQHDVLPPRGRTSRAVFTSRSTPARPSCITRAVSGPGPSSPRGPLGIRPSTRNESRAIRSTTGPTCISRSVALT